MIHVNVLRGCLSPVGHHHFPSADLNNSRYTRKQIRAQVDTCCFMLFRLEFPSLLRGQLEATPQGKDKPGPWWLLRSSFYLYKSLLSKAFPPPKMHVLYSFSVVKSGMIIRHNYSLHLLCGRSHFKHARALLSLQHSRYCTPLICCFANTCP